MAGRADKAEIEAFITDRAVDGFPHVFDEDGSVWAALGIQTQPALVFIDDSGELAVHYGSIGIEDLTTVVEQLSLQ